jgi:hypothetical protein
LRGMVPRSRPSWRARPHPSAEQRRIVSVRCRPPMSRLRSGYGLCAAGVKRGGAPVDRGIATSPSIVGRRSGGDCAVVTVPCMVTVAAGVFTPGHLGELTRYLPLESVDDVLEGTAQRRLRALPSRVGVYLVLAPALFPVIGYLRVLRQADRRAGAPGARTPVGEGAAGLRGSTWWSIVITVLAAVGVGVLVSAMAAGDPTSFHRAGHRGQACIGYSGRPVRGRGAGLVSQCRRPPGRRRAPGGWPR